MPYCITLRSRTDALITGASPTVSAPPSTAPGTRPTTRALPSPAGRHLRPTAAARRPVDPRPRPAERTRHHAMRSALRGKAADRRPAASRLRSESAEGGVLVFKFFWNKRSSWQVTVSGCATSGPLSRCQRTAQIDPSRSLSFAFGTALPAPFRPLTGATRIGSRGGNASCPDLSGV